MTTALRTIDKLRRDYPGEWVWDALRNRYNGPSFSVTVCSQSDGEQAWTVYRRDDTGELLPYDSKPWRIP